jgi:hypothetical protein
MKTLLQIAIVCLCAYGIIHLDVLLYNFIVSLIPSGDWKPLLKVIIVIVMVVYTSGIVIWLTIIASAISLMILNIFMPKKSSIYQTKNLQKKSTFQQKLEQMSKNKNL